MANQPDLKKEVSDLVEALGQWAVTSATDRMSSMGKRLTRGASDREGSDGPLASAVSAAVGGGMDRGAGGALKEGVKGVAKGTAKSAKGAIPGGGGGAAGGGGVKATNIVESIDLGVPLGLAYNLWTEYAEFPNFMKGTESVEPDDEDPQQVTWKAHVAFSHRTWEATVTEQVPDKRIVWTSKGNKGYVDGAVTFHELAPELTRILVVLEYHPQGFVEWVANRWRAAGRRARLDLKHFRRHAMTRALLNSEEVEGWRGEIRDGEVVKDHQAGLREEREERGGEQEERGYAEEWEEPEDREAPEGDEQEPEDREALEGDEEEPEDLEEPRQRREDTHQRREEARQRREEAHQRREEARQRREDRDRQRVRRRPGPRRQDESRRRRSGQGTETVR